MLTAETAPEGASTRVVRLHDEWVPHGYQQRAVRHLMENHAAALFLDPGLGKLQPVSTPVYTPSGWRPIGSIALGDLVYSVDGKPTRVVGVFPQSDRRCYRVTFRDGTSTLCGPEHLWTVAATHWSAQKPLTNRRAWKTLTTHEIVDRGVTRPKPCGRKGAHWRVPIAEPVEHPEAALPIDPYTLGALIGDGALTLRSSVTLSVPPGKMNVLERVQEADSVWQTPRQSGSACPRSSAVPSREMRDALDALGLRVRSPERFIPSVYKSASVAQRMELLRGLMDTDGSASKNRITFHTVSQALASDVAELVRSLGGIAIERCYDRATEGKPVEWQINVKTTFCPFHSDRKAAEWRPHKLARIIASIEPAEPQESVCIKVEHPTGLYLTEHFIVTHNTAITLEAFRRLKEAGMAEKMLVVAPLRVCQLVWRQEGKKWSQFRDLTFTLLHGPKKDERLHEDTDIHLINPEGIAWFTKQFFGRSGIPYDVVSIDELTKFKNHQAKRSKALRKKLQHVRYRWGLTGSPAPNGYMDLFGQMLILDDGASLGRYITYFRDQYFNRGYDGFSYELRPGADERIERKIAPYVLRMSAEDYLELPPLVDHIIEIDLSTAEKAQYEEMKKEMLLTLPEGIITGANSGAIYSKLKQMSNGAVYLSEQEGGKKKWAELHDHKLSALEELIEELSGRPLLVAYEFQSDLARIRARLGEDTPTLSGISAAKIEEVEGQWNRGELPVLLVHPASAGHGLNLQGAGASHICWFSRPWDLEQVDQTVRRIYRQGNTSDRVVNHVLVVRGTMDETVGEALKLKDTTQNRLLTALNAEIMRDNPATTPSRATPMEIDTMALKKLGFKGNTGGDVAGSAEKPAAPKGWGTKPAEPETVEETPETDAPVRPKGWGPPEGVETPETEQRSNIQQRLRAPAPTQPAEEEEEEVPASVKALEAFPKGMVDQLNGDDVEETELVDGAASDEELWGDLSTRYVNVLSAAGLTSAAEAFAHGKSDLIANVEGFGAKGWEELSALFGASEETEEEEAPAQTQPKGWGKPERAVEQEQEDKASFQRQMDAPEKTLGRMVNQAEKDVVEDQKISASQIRDHGAISANYDGLHYNEGVHINISVNGLSRTEIAALFTALAKGM